MPDTPSDNASAAGRRRAVPTPAHPQRRREPLPWHQPKSAQEDPAAPARVRAILSDPAYREAEADTAFLRRDETRGLRLQLEYLKPQVLLGEHGIHHTIVVFGSTRIVEPTTARRRVDAARTKLERAPGDAELVRHLAVAERVLAKSHYYAVARDFGRMVAEHRHTPEGDLVVMTGGGPGMMEAANRGAYDAGAETVGLNISLPHEQYPNPYVTPELCFRFHYFALRKLHFLLRAKALVAFPGGYGTFDELFETLALIQTRKINPVPVILVGEEYWRRAFDADFLIAEGTIDREDGDLFWYAETAREIWDGIVEWYDRSGASLIQRRSQR